jgi:hypothetical protein
VVVAVDPTARSWRELMNAFRILVLVVATIAGGLVGYQIGLAQDLAADGARVAYWPGFGFGFGWFLFLLLILAFVFAFRPRWGPGGPGGPGRHGRWRDGFDEWHRRAHEEPGVPPSTQTDRS